MKKHLAHLAAALAVTLLFGAAAGPLSAAAAAPTAILDEENTAAAESRLNQSWLDLEIEYNDLHPVYQLYLSSAAPDDWVYQWYSTNPAVATVDRNCPRCGQPVYEGKNNFACSDRSCGFVLWKNDRFWTSRKKELTKKIATDLLKKGRTNVKGMWSEKKQATYDAAVILNDTGGKYINFKLEFPKRKEGVNGRK